MDIAGLSAAMHQHQVQMDAGLVMMDKSKQLAEQSGEQLIEMLEKSMSAPHPILGSSVDLSV